MRGLHAGKIINRIMDGNNIRIVNNDDKMHYDIELIDYTFSAYN
jgi:hypothetical protein